MNVCSQAIGRLWAAERADFVNKLKQRTLGAAALVGTDYHLNITVAESTLSKLQESTALFDFTISNSSHESVSGYLHIFLYSLVLICTALYNGPMHMISHAFVLFFMQQNDKLCMELSHPELFSFFQQLETVQQQLDSLGGSASAESA